MSGDEVVDRIASMRPSRVFGGAVQCGRGRPLSKLQNPMQQRERRDLLGRAGT